ncbi:hypothetical protein [Acetobacter conturbans]|uniref:Uncharacterized protein n=1 Tax=Acetobacter conturbans TaxID=1737472 RepID=A0ABX0K1Z9_9PROT|nr:hypothetical protein [Acetobacter conturbans]NHN88323.1 hypothetical protein [Acetobacter conturbans]
MRELTMVEMGAVAGGCCWQPCRPSQPVAPSCGNSSAALIAAYAGYLAGEYNVVADIFNHASCSTVQQAVSNVCTDIKTGYTAGLSMTVAQATTLLTNVTSEIKSSITISGCGGISAMNLVDFPPTASSGTAFG